MMHPFANWSCRRRITLQLQEKLGECSFVYILQEGLSSDFEVKICCRRVAETLIPATRGYAFLQMPFLASRLRRFGDAGQSAADQLLVPRVHGQIAEGDDADQPLVIVEHH